MNTPFEMKKKCERSNRPWSTQPHLAQCPTQKRPMSRLGYQPPSILRTVVAPLPDAVKKGDPWSHWIGPIATMTQVHADVGRTLESRRGVDQEGGRYGDPSN